MVLKERIGFYKSQIKSRLGFVKTKFMALSKWLKIAVITALVSSLVGLILFVNRDKPESMIKDADKSFEFSANDDLKPFISYFPKLGEDLLLKKISSFDTSY